MAVYSNITVDQGTDYTASVDVTDADGDAGDYGDNAYADM